MSYYEDYWEKNSNWSPSAGGLRENEADFFERYCGEGVTVLDYGCGDAFRYGGRLVERKADYRGFDISHVAVEAARGRGINVGLLSDDGKTSLSDGQAQTALCFEVLEHLMRPDVAVAEIYRCLGKDGVFLMSVPNPGFVPQRFEFFLTGFLCPGGSPETSRRCPWKDAHIRFYNTWMLRKLLKEAGFRDIQFIGCRFSIGHFPVIYRKPGLKRFFDLISLPLYWLGKVFPSWFSGTFYVKAIK